jgi:hypothetical protein
VAGRGKCSKSTESEKYLGHFQTPDECEAACLSYSVGSSRCRCLRTDNSSHTDNNFHTDNSSS